MTACAADNSELQGRSPFGCNRAPTIVHPDSNNEGSWLLNWAYTAHVFSLFIVCLKHNTKLVSKLPDTLTEVGNPYSLLSYKLIRHFCPLCIQVELETPASGCRMELGWSHWSRGNYGMHNYKQ